MKVKTDRSLTLFVLLRFRIIIMLKSLRFDKTSCKLWKYFSGVLKRHFSAFQTLDQLYSTWTCRMPRAILRSSGNFLRVHTSLTFSRFGIIKSKNVHWTAAIFGHRRDRLPAVSVLFMFFLGGRRVRCGWGSCSCHWGRSQISDTRLRYDRSGDPPARSMAWWAGAHAIGKLELELRQTSSTSAVRSSHDYNSTITHYNPLI